MYLKCTSQDKLSLAPVTNRNLTILFLAPTWASRGLCLLWWIRSPSGWRLCLNPCTHNILGSWNERWQTALTFQVSPWKRHITFLPGSLAKASCRTTPDLNPGGKCRPHVFQVEGENWKICEQVWDSQWQMHWWPVDGGQCRSKKQVGVALVTRDRSFRESQAIKLARLAQGLDRGRREEASGMGPTAMAESSSKTIQPWGSNSRDVGMWLLLEIGSLRIN